MVIEFCKKKTICSKCGISMRKDDIRGKIGKGYYNDPFRYLCFDCMKKHGFSIDELILVYKKIIKKYQKKIDALIKLQKLI